MFCLKCGKANTDSSKYCVGCGAELPKKPAPAPNNSTSGQPTVLCPRCGAVNNNSARYCLGCGATMPSTAYTTGSYSSATTATIKKDHSTGKGIFCLKCGKANTPTSSHCVGCGAALPSPAGMATKSPESAHISVSCPKCGATNNSSARYCLGCGATLPSTLYSSGAYSSTTEAKKDFDKGKPVFCPKCGKANISFSAHCVGCGAVLPTPAGMAAVTTLVAPRKDISRRIKKIATPIAVISALTIILAFLGVFKSGAEKAVLKYMKACFEGNGEVVYRTSVDPYYAQYLIDSEFTDYNSTTDIINQYIEWHEDDREYYEDTYGSDVKAKFEVTKVTKYSKDDLRLLNKYINTYQDHVYTDKNVLQDIRVFKVRASYEGSEDSDTESTEIVAYKIRDRWYAGDVADLYNKDQIDDVIDYMK